MEKRVNETIETYKALKENRDRRDAAREKAIQESVDKHANFLKNYYSAIDKREYMLREHSRLMESAKNNALGDVLKAVYITALEAATLTDNGIILAESMVDQWIQENGGATAIFNKCRANTYLLSRIKQIVEDAAEDEVKEIEKIADDDGSDDNKKENKESEDKSEKDDKKDDKESDSEEDSNKDNSEDKSEKSEEDDKKEDEESDSEEEDSSKNDDPADSEDSEDTDKKEDNSLLNTTFDDDEDDEEIPDDATTEEDDNETDTAEDIVDDIEEVPDEDLTVDGDSENKGKVFDELEKEDDIRKAIELIRQRVADAEETFIKRNAEDKKAIDELISRISDNVKTVEDIDNEAEEKSKIAQEAAMNYKRKINSISENRPLTIMEKMSRNLIKGITKDNVVREQYLSEDGTVDITMAMESAKVMYGFLETINTLQLEKVDAKYLEKVLNEM